MMVYPLSLIMVALSIVPINVKGVHGYGGKSFEDGRFHHELKEHLDKKTSPKTLKYSAWANIPADDELKNHTVKAKAEQHFVEALKALPLGPSRETKH